MHGRLRIPIKHTRLLVELLRDQEVAAPLFGLVEKVVLRFLQRLVIQARLGILLILQRNVAVDNIRGLNATQQVVLEHVSIFLEKFRHFNLNE